MRKIPIEYAREGDILGKSLYNNHGSMLLREGTELNDNIIKRLEKFGCFSIFIKDKYTDQVIEEIIKPEAINRIHNLQESLNKIVIDFNQGKRVDSKKLNTNIRTINEIIDEIVYEVLFSKDILEHLINISTYDDYTLNHSINVMMLSTVIARDRNFNMDEIKKLAIGCIFHDIGKTFIPIEIIKKPGKLTDEEFEIIKTHSEKGFEFLKTYTHLPMTSINIALCHHERENGSGYPRNLESNEIHLFSKIASVCDVFDALISDRSYRRALPVKEAMEYMMSTGGDDFSMDIIKTFSQAINVFPKDTLISLSDGREGIIDQANKEIHSRPVVKIYGENGKEVSPYSINLMEYSNIVIEDVIYKFTFD